ncbi:putative FAS-associated factor 2 [Apostichopus japonicus]|uniref:Putative FAS-associated factor 2 n=1 Tax=Stichopus japonicus TaxID=307972 RepID=A0A2G8LDA2_STIJA|nr:putative FAS-associated factor 2 [Apostichopus japonicus]
MLNLSSCYLHHTYGKMDDNEEELDQEQTEKLLLFQDLSGIEDIERCKRILQQHNYNIEAAVQDTLNESEGRPLVYNQPQSQPQERPPTVDTQPFVQRVYTVARPLPSHGWFQWSYMLILLPFRIVYSTICNLFPWIARMLWNDPRLNVVDPQGDVLKFVRYFTELYGLVHPNFYLGTYSQALNDAKRDLKYVLVYLHSNEHQDTDHFCRTTLANDDVTNFVNEHMIFWAASVDTPEGYRVSRALKENTYPFLALIVLRNSKLTVVLKIEGPIEPEDLVAKLTRGMRDNEGYLVAARQERADISLSQNLRQEQDEAYRESLRQDEEKEKKKRVEQEKLEQEEAARKEEEQRSQQLKEDKIRMRLEKAANLPAEPDADDPECVRLLIKLPNGVRLDRCFRKTDSLEVIYDYVYVQDDVPEEFQLQTNYPRRVLQCQPAGEGGTTPIPTVDEAGLKPKEMLFVQDISD